MVATSAYEAADFVPAFQQLPDQLASQESRASRYGHYHLFSHFRSVSAAFDRFRILLLTALKNGVHDGRHTPNLCVGNRRCHPFGCSPIKELKEAIHSCEVVQVGAEESPRVSSERPQGLARLVEWGFYLSERTG